MSFVDRSSPSGPAARIKRTMALATLDVAVTALATQTGTFSGAKVNDVVTCSPRANLNGALAIAWARVVATDVIAVAFNNVGASTNTGAVTFDTCVEHSS